MRNAREAIRIFLRGILKNDGPITPFASMPHHTVGLTEYFPWKDNIREQSVEFAMSGNLAEQTGKLDEYPLFHLAQKILYKKFDTKIQNGFNFAPLL